MVDMHQGFTTMYIYMESRVVDDRLAPMLRSVAVSGLNGSTVSKCFDHGQYVPLLSKEFGIDVRDDTGRRVPFELGSVKVTLHFRRRRVGLF
ncbi:MAG: hypothetical protein M3H12_03315 [Chromatiales bacterium]